MIRPLISSSLCALSLVTLFAQVLAPSPVAHAAPKRAEAKADEAAALIAEGNKLRRAGRDDAALEKFDRAYAINATPRAAAQKGLCLQALGRFTEAEEFLAKSLEGDGDPWVIKNRSTIKDSIEDVKTKIGRFEITGSPQGARVLVDGRLVGQFPLAGMVRINAGAAVLEVKAEGYVAERTPLTVQGASFRRLEFELKKETSALAAAPMPANAVEDSSTAALSASADDSSSQTPVYKKAWFWGVVGAVVIGGVVAGVLLSGGKEVNGPKVDSTAGL